MAAIGGSIEEISIKGRRFAVSADSDSNLTPGGTENEVMPNGDGTARLVQTRKAWVAEGLDVEIDDDRGDVEFLQDIAAAHEFVPITVTYASGNTRQMRGTVVGELKVSSKNATCGLTLSGPGEAEKQ